MLPTKQSPLELLWITLLREYVLASLNISIRLLSISNFCIFKKEESSSTPSTMEHLSKIWILFAEEICLFSPLFMSVCLSLDVELYIYFIQLLCLRLHYRRQQLPIKSTTAIKDLQWYPSSSLHCKKYDIKKAHQLVL